MDSLSHSLSGGQLQRLVLARELLRKRSLLLLDEPTAALDPAAEAELWRTVRAVTHSQQLITICVTHRLEHLQQFDLVLGLKAGQKLLWGTPREVESSSAWKKLYADVQNV
jgi:ABC-type transport system involved in cytochrome bd biosynthesis fused ATPase/permease subunit